VIWIVDTLHANQPDERTDHRRSAECNGGDDAKSVVAQPHSRDRCNHRRHAEWTDNSGGPIAFLPITLISPTEIPLDQLNGNLTGLAPERPLSLTSGQSADEALPEPGAITLLASSLATLALIPRRKRTAA
jgi:hypothetical protein